MSVHSHSFRLPKVTLPGGGYISKGEDGRIVVAGRESLRILRISSAAPKIESRNFWEGSGLKVDCASTDVAWACGVFNNKILTSARNGELIMWDTARSGHSKFERRTKEHLRSIHAMTVSRVVHHYCMTGSADGDFRVWDLRNIQSSIIRVHNPSAVRRVVFSPCLWNPLFVLVGMDNGTLHRWDLKMGQRGLLDRLPVAHTAPITTIDWYSGGEKASHAISFSAQQGPDDYTGNTLGWVATASLDHCVKIWDLTGPDAAAHMPNKPTYSLHPSYPIRRVLWRPGYECELAVVSHADFTVSSQVDHLLSGTPVPSLSGGLHSRVGSSLGVDSVLQSLSDLKLAPKEPKLSSDQSNPILDAVEIWDVRRSWLPKWSVSGTSVEGGVTDIEFGDSFTLLAQNTNGTFTQLDTRDTSKPLDAISRTSATWTPHGAFAFVTDNPSRWEIPYDDIQPSRPNQEPKVPIKHIGDRPFRPTTQKLGTFAFSQSHLEADSFSKLASSYVIEGDDSSTLCETNMQAAGNLGKPQMAQIWMLMAISLTKHIPNPLPALPQSPPPRVASLGNLPKHALSTPASGLTSYSFPSAASTSRSPEISRARGSPFHFPPINNSSRLSQRSPSTSQRPTPASSNSSSPLHLSKQLPPITPRRLSTLARRESLDSGIPAGRSALLRRQSVSAAHHSASPIDKNSTSIKHAGEGVLSDDSSTPETGDERDEQTVGAESSGDDLPVVPTPSPLSRLKEPKHWTEEEEDGAPSPSPGSTDTDSDGGTSIPRKTTLNKSRRIPGKTKSRSRSSTLASLPAAPTFSLQRGSQSSARAIAAAETSSRAQEPDSAGVRDEVQTSTSRNRGKHAPSGREKQEDQLVNDLQVVNSNAAKVEKMTARRADLVARHESQMLDYTWEVLRDSFEELLVLGDVQNAATMAAIAPRELQVAPRRRLHIFDAYIDQLLRCQLYTSAAYFRKYSHVQKIKEVTLLDTTIYTICGRCKKPVVKPVIHSLDTQRKLPRYSFCLGCKAPTATCAICRLPVRNMLFQCSICRHGGHQSCYRQFYLNHPMVDIPPVSIDEHRGRTFAKGGGPSISPARSPQTKVAAELAGHPCAAGCGHYCWATLKQI